MNGTTVDNWIAPVGVFNWIISESCENVSADFLLPQLCPDFVFKILQNGIIDPAVTQICEIGVVTSWIILMTTWDLLGGFGFVENAV